MLDSPSISAVCHLWQRWKPHFWTPWHSAGCANGLSKVLKTLHILTLSHDITYNQHSLSDSSLGCERVFCFMFVMRDAVSVVAMSSYCWSWVVAAMTCPTTLNCCRNPEQHQPWPASEAAVLLWPVQCLLHSADTGLSVRLYCTHTSDTKAVEVPS